MFIAVEGVTGIGKSTLQGVLSSLYASQTLVMNFEKHPYFDIPHLSLSEYVLEREMIFMLMGYHELKNLDLANRLVISDFVFDRFRVFAGTVLPRVDLESLFYPCFHHLRRKLPKPELILRLVGSPSFVMSRIRGRGRGGEDYVSEDYLLSLSESFDELFQELEDCRVITLNSEDYDFLVNPTDVQVLTSRMEAELPQLSCYRIG